MYNLIKYTGSYLKIFGILWQFYKDVPALDDYGVIINFNATNATTRLFNLKVKWTGQTNNDAIKDVEIVVPLKFLSNFWRTLEMLLINCEINLDLNWSKNTL